MSRKGPGAREGIGDRVAFGRPFAARVPERFDRRTGSRRFLLLFGYFGLPAILESVLPRTLSETLHRKTTIREIRFDPFKLSLSILGLEIGSAKAKGPGSR